MTWRGPRRGRHQTGQQDQSAGRCRLLQSRTSEQPDECREPARRLAALQAISAALSATLTPARIAEVVLREALPALGACAGVINLLVDAHHLEPVASVGFPEELMARWRRFGVDAPVPAAQCLESGPIYLHLAGMLDRYPELAEAARRRGEGSWACLALEVEGRRLGSLGLTYSAPRPFDAEERGFIETVAGHCAQALERARLHQSEHQLLARAEAAASGEREARALLQALIDHAPLGLCFWDTELRYQLVNPRLAEMNGMPVEAHLGRRPTEVVPGVQGIQEIEARLRQVIQTGQPTPEVEVSGETAAAPGQLRFWQESWYPVHINDRVIGVGALVRETTEQRRALELQGLLTAIVGHDLRNPLAAMITTLEVLKRLGPLEGNRQRCLEVLAASTLRMKRLLADLGDLTVASGPGIELRRGPVHLDTICRPLISELEAAYPGRSVRYQTCGDGTGRWDALRMGQVLSNLIANALRHGDQTSEVEVRWDGTDPARITLVVENQGPDIPPDLLVEILQPFRRNRRPSAEREGLGLGLFIVDHLVRAHGGSLQPRSGGGRTSFQIELPREPVARSAPAC